MAATLTDRDAEFSRAVGMDDLEQAGVADRCGVGAVVEPELGWTLFSWNLAGRTGRWPGGFDPQSGRLARQSDRPHAMCVR
jgi:hypothetical protein